MKTRVIHTRFWSDGYITTLNHKEKLVFMYLMTNDKINIAGIYELPDKYILFDLDLKPEELETIKVKFHKDKKIAFFNGWVRLVNVDKFNKYRGPQNDKARIKEYNLAPKEILEYPYSIYTSNDTSIVDTSNKKLEIRNQKQEINNKKEDEEQFKEMREKLKKKLNL